MYEKNHATFDQNYRSNDLRLYHVILNVCGLKKDGKVFEIESGENWLDFERCEMNIMKYFFLID